MTKVYNKPVYPKWMQVTGSPLVRGIIKDTLDRVQDPSIPISEYHGIQSAKGGEDHDRQHK